MPADFADLLTCLNEAGADYMLVGGYAVMAHGHLRATQDIDVWVRATPDNARCVLSALQAFGMPPGLSVEVLERVDGDPPTGFRFGRPPFAVDLLTSIQGVDFEDAFSESLVHKIDGISIRIIGKRALLENKRSTGREKDRIDADALEMMSDAESADEE